ncbi:MAG: hypothetical protein GXP31_19340 [Kiritimatiellaeota bacterium]|nr:hypothetical protein [Kiritimatiellota bacterium]
MIHEMKRLTTRIGAYDPLDAAGYERLGGFRGLRQALSKAPADVIGEVADAGLQGRGGAGFAAARKWSFVAAQERHPKYLICNADEGELGTVKDRLLLEGDPWAVAEGLLITAYATGADVIIVYIRGAYREAFCLWKELAERVSAELRRPELWTAAAGRAAPELRVVRGRGLYIAGEEMALIASLAARRPVSASKPPYPAEKGLFGMPTVVHNVETVANVPLILADGAGEYRTVGTEEEPGTRLFSLSGNIRRPGVYELPIGSTTLAQLIDDLGGGTLDGRPPKAVQPGGGTSALLSAAHLNTRMSSADLRAAGSSAGTGGVIVYGADRNAVSIVDELLGYYGGESCGMCMPCRVGTLKMREIVKRLLAGDGCAADIGRLRAVGETCVKASTCGMGQSFPLPVLSALKLFPRDFESLVRVPPRTRTPDQEQSR